MPNKKAQKNNYNRMPRGDDTFGRSSKIENITITHIRNSEVNFIGRDQIIQNINITRAFETIYRAIESLPEGQRKISVQQAVQGLESESKLGNSVDKGRIGTWLDTLANLAPDIFEVVLKTLVNPIEGVSLVFRKIIERASRGIR